MDNQRNHRVDYTNIKPERAEHTTPKIKRPSWNTVRPFTLENQSAKRNRRICNSAFKNRVKKAFKNIPGSGPNPMARPGRQAQNGPKAEKRPFSLPCISYNVHYTKYYNSKNEAFPHRSASKFLPLTSGSSSWAWVQFLIHFPHPAADYFIPAVPFQSRRRLPGNIHARPAGLHRHRRTDPHPQDWLQNTVRPTLLDTLLLPGL